jgi:hypothetical protein
MHHLILPLNSLIFTLTLLGWGFFFKKWLKTELSIGLFNATAFCGLVMFYSLFIHAASWSAFLLLIGGAGLFFWCMIELFKQDKEELKTVAVYLCLAFLVSLMAVNMRFRSIDDYAFWGLISKYLFLFKTFPHTNDYISANFLTYIPGMASFHFLFYFLNHHYSQYAGYFAQGMILVAAMMPFYSPKHSKQSILYLCIWYLCFGFGYGMVLGRMEVDAYIAAFLLAIVWIIYKQGRERNVAPLILMPLVFMSTIKEIGLFLAFIPLVLLLFTEKPTRKVWLWCIFSCSLLILTKMMWKWHTQILGFHSFAQAITLDKALAALTPGNAYYHAVKVLYLKALLFSGADKVLYIPYLVVYLAQAVMWIFFYKKAALSKYRMHRINLVMALFTLGYLVMIYYLQALVFNVGHDNPDILDFPRYFNMLFLPWLALMIYMGLDEYQPLALKSLKHPLSLTIIMFSCVLLIAGKIERLHKYYQPHDLYAVYRAIAGQTKKLANPNWSLCLFHPPQPAFELTLPLVYFFMPHQVRALENQGEINHCDISYG